MLEVVLGFLDAVAPGERWAVIGASYGAYLARGIAHHRARQISGLMLYAPLVIPASDQREVPEHRVLFSDPQALASRQPDERRWADIGVALSQEVLADYRFANKPGVEVANRDFVERMEAAFSTLG